MLTSTNANRYVVVTANLQLAIRVAFSKEHPIEKKKEEKEKNYAEKEMKL